MPDLNKLSSYDYQLPDELIASEPLSQREKSRLLVVERQSGQISHHVFEDLISFLNPGDALVLNQTKVLKARLFGHREKTGGAWEGLFLNSPEPARWIIIGQCGGKLKAGENIIVRSALDPSQPPLLLHLLQRLNEGQWLVAPHQTGTPEEILARYGCLPLPPYMKRKLSGAEDEIHYQTAYATTPGAVAAPTAGLHFTPELLHKCQQKQIDSVRLTLHIGLGTFRPIKAEMLSDHQMHFEWCELSAEAALQLDSVRAAGKRIVAVGTTSVRTLESASQSGHLQPFQGETNLFIRPGYEFHSVDALITNFHLPMSSLLVMIAAFAGYDLIMEAYQKAIESRYRFYSYGDAMLII